MELLERAPHLEELDHHLREATQGHGNMVFLGGEAGAGKTALVQHFAEHVPAGVRVLIGACDALASPRPLGPFLDVASSLGPHIERLLWHTGRPPELFGAVLRALATGGPTLFIIDDAHWADEATLDLLKFLGRRVDTTPALIVVTYRDDEVLPNHPLGILVGDLTTRACVRKMKADLLSQDAVRILGAGSPVDATELFRKTDGNPFYVTEALASVTATLPVTVRDAVLARAARLSPGGRRALDAAAVIGRHMPPWLLVAVVPSAADAIDECLAMGLLQSQGGELRFRHQLAQEAVLDAISPVRAVELHGAVLAALQARSTTVEHSAELAYHAEAAGDMAAVLRYAPAAAEHAAHLGSHRQAAAQLARALRFAADLPVNKRASLLEQWMHESHLASLLDDAVLAAQELLAIARSAGDRVLEANYLTWQSRLQVLLGMNDDSERTSIESLRILADLPPGQTHAFAYQNQANLRMLNRDHAMAIEWGERAMTLARQLGDKEAIVRAMNAVGSARLVSGEAEGGRAQLEEGIRIATRDGLDSDVASLLSNLGSGHGEIYQLDHADHYLTECIRFATEHDLDGSRWYSTSWLALVRMLQGRWSEATDLADAVIRTPASQGIPRMMALIAIGRVRTRRGDPEAAIVLDEALDLVESTGTLQRLAPVREARAEAAWLAGKHGQAAGEANAAYELAARHHHAWHIGELGYWRWQAGDLHVSPPGAADPYALQMTGDWEAAAALWSRLGCPYEAARARAESEDEAALREAFHAFDQLGARPAAAMVSQRLRNLGAKSVPRGLRSATRSNPALLTARELDVLHLIASGSTNSDIARRLFLSVKTVEHHVSAILSKLDVTSRRDASRTAKEQHLLPQTEGHQSPN